MMADVTGPFEPFLALWPKIGYGLPARGRQICNVNLRLWQWMPFIFICMQQRRNAT